MKLTFADSPDIDELNFKRLLLLGEELIFVDRPSIQLADNYGTVGRSSGLRELTKEFDGSAITLRVDEPPNSSFNSHFYHKYFEKDLDNPEYINAIFEGIARGWIYDHHFDKSKDCATGEFKDYRNWISSNKDEIRQTRIYDVERPETLFKITNKSEALFAFKIIASSQSMTVSSTLYICNKYGSSPISINPTLNKLISLRLSNDIYNGRPIKSRQLGFRIMDCIIPDEGLMQIPWQDILEFRKKTQDYFDAWNIEINKMEAVLFKDNDSLSDLDVINLVDSDINPKLLELKNEIRRIKDDRYKNILKTLKNTFLSGIALGTLSGLSIPGAIASFIGANFKTPKFTDDIIDAHFQLKDKKQSNGLTYLLKIKELTE